MDVREVGQSGQQARPDDDDDDDDDRVVPEAWRSKPFRLMVMAAVVVLTAGIGFGVGKLAGVGNNVVRADIPRPERTADPFIEGSGSIADNSHENILSTTDMSTPAGRSQGYDAVVNAFIADYGGSVRLTPQSQTSWILPPLPVVGGLGLLFVVGRRWGAKPPVVAAGAAPAAVPVVADADLDYADKLDDELASTD